MIGSIFDQTNFFGKALDASWLRNEVIANNISNIDTPNFKSSSVIFESTLKEALEGTRINMKKTNAKHINIRPNFAEPSVVQNNDTTMRMDGNNVDIENEQLNLLKNVIKYNTMIHKVSKELGMIRVAINEGK